MSESEAESLLELDSSQALAAGRTKTRTHVWMLSIALAVIALSFLLNVRRDGRVEFIFLPDVPLPESCASKVLFSAQCPGCGLTRSFIFLAHGRLSESLAVHGTGWLLALLTVAQIPYRLYRIRENRLKPHVPVSSWPTFVSWTVLAALLGHWLIANVIVPQFQ